MSELQIAGASLTGDRASNQDRLGWWAREDTVFLVLADGLGGHAGGALAAETLIDQARATFSGASLPLDDPLGFLRRLLVETHERLLLAGLERAPSTTPMTTAALVLVQGQRVWWATLGDSRVYWLRPGCAVQLSRDHSYAEELLEQGLLQEPLPLDHPWRSRLTRCLGGFPSAPPPHCGGPFGLAVGEGVLLCSDGLWGPLEADSFTRLNGSEDLAAATEGLARAAVERAAPNADNTTLLVARRGVASSEGL